MGFLTSLCCAAGICGIPAGKSVGAWLSPVFLVKAVLLGDRQGCGIGEWAGRSATNVDGGVSQKKSFL